MPIFVPIADSLAQPVVLGVHHQGSASGAVHLLVLSIGTLILGLDSEALSLKENLPLSKMVNPFAGEPINIGVQMNFGLKSVESFTRTREQMSKAQHFFFIQCTDRSALQQPTFNTFCTVGKP